MENTLEILEKERRHALIPFWILIAMIVVALGAFVFSVPAGVIILIASLALYALLYSKFRKAYVKKYKELAVRYSLEKTFDGLEYDVRNGFTEKYIRSLGCMEMGSDFESEDKFSGVYNGVPFESSEVYIANTTVQSNGMSETTVFFHGRWTVFDFNKNFKYNLQVRQKGFTYAKKSGGLFSSDRPMKKISMESSDFNRAFTVYGADEHEAFYLLTPALMAEMLRLRDFVKGKLMFCFIESKLHVALCDNKDSFEPPVFSRLTDEWLLNDITGEISKIVDFVDGLKLEKKIWTTGGNN